MAELTPDDLNRYTKGRLPGGTDEDTQDLLDAALAAARRYCGWSVSPVQTGVRITVDGPGGRVLSLPTLHLIAVTAISENGVPWDTTKIDVSQEAGTLEKFPHGVWTSRKGGISVTMTHGHTEAEAADWRRAVLRLADLMDRDDKNRDSGDLVRKRVDDVEYQWALGIISTDARLEALFSQYRILLAP
ncbi:hypothetical protein [Mycobacteroides abscessus]|uniref:hypothetical protein n=1 Tax=Mycobacteroides abscessus TaxID=36809 RepID=UPI001A9C36B3|nr:hypothetical protein [Mycobacteroides abscessus]